EKSRRADRKALSRLQAADDSFFSLVDRMSDSTRRRTMGNRLNDEGMNLLFREARTHSHWLDKPVNDEMLRELYDLMKWAPTSMTSSRARILFLRTPEANQRRLPALASGNVDKTMSAPVTAIIGYDLHFYEKLQNLVPHNPGAGKMFADAPQLTEVTAR